MWGRLGWRGTAVRTVFAIVVLGQVALIVHGYRDPHKRFAFQPFSESSTWRADITRVLADGRRIPVNGPWHGYEWTQLVRERGLGFYRGMHHADSGVDSVLDFLQRALDWVALNTPNDRETLYFEARVVYHRNRKGPHTVTLRSVERSEPGVRGAP